MLSQTLDQGYALGTSFPLYGVSSQKREILLETKKVKKSRRGVESAFLRVVLHTILLQDF